MPALFPPGTSPKARSAPSNPEPRTPLVTKSRAALVKVLVMVCARTVEAVTRKANRNKKSLKELVDFFGEGLIRACCRLLAGSLFTFYKTNALDRNGAAPPDG